MSFNQKRATEGPSGLIPHGEMLLCGTLAPPFGPDSHLLQRLTHFNPLSLYSWFGGPSGRIHIAAQLAHLIVAGGVCVHEEEEEGQLVWFKPTTNLTY